MNEKLLPLGSVVYLEEGIIPLMIVLRQPIIQVENEICYLDYAGISQITGLNIEEIAYFNQEDISKIVSEGYRGENEERILSALDEWREQNPTIPRGKVSDVKKQIENSHSSNEKNEELIVEADDTAGLFAGLHDGWD